MSAITKLPMARSMHSALISYHEGFFIYLIIRYLEKEDLNHDSPHMVIVIKETSQYQLNKAFRIKDKQSIIGSSN